MRIVFTGPAVIDGQRVTRDRLIKMAEAAGHTVGTSVTKSTDVVVASTPDFMERKGSKLRKADEYGIDVITPETFFWFVKEA